MVKREYYTREGKLDARELFDEEGFVTERSYHNHGEETPDMHWYINRGTPVKLITTLSSSRFSRQGPGTYEKQGLDWVKVK